MVKFQGSLELASERHEERATSRASTWAKAVFDKMVGLFAELKVAAFRVKLGLIYKL